MWWLHLPKKKSSDIVPLNGDDMPPAQRCWTLGSTIWVSRATGNTSPKSRQGKRLRYVGLSM
jgi:hypothetical protein